MYTGLCNNLRAESVTDYLSLSPLMSIFPPKPYPGDFSSILYGPIYCHGQ